ncbi:hypothetical protein PNEG_03298 [Pneumocystis murina B123]|uniref:N-acetyltransferase domain-containing protein n=1 Tax=Pneumocystis murina (strain B123) TaxID=1069680 RepID=M7P3P2_PNEMU|nr:hypothetical protein PNEG_03298 [Pneumocystis murina B123]EMR08470.1 hypothetical protein PNEG_03298 [Pneumocystis murina B123]
MSELRRFKATDIFSFNNINLDILTETYNISFYLSYLATWPNLFLVQETSLFEGKTKLMGYVMGKTEGIKKQWHGHITALSVASEYRRLGVARDLIKLLENISENMYNGYFVDLFVRHSNLAAISMYKSLGYSVFRRVIKYYNGSKGDDEDALDMRKPLSRDKFRESIRENGDKIFVLPEDIYF